MKKMITLVFAIFLCLYCLLGCSNQNNGKTDSRIDVALTALDETWKDCKYEIKNTRIIVMKETDVDFFADIDYIVEFVLYTDYYGSAPYLSNVGINDSVSVYKDGTVEVNERNPFDTYRSRSFIADFSGIIEEIIDLGDSYNTEGTEKNEKA